MEERYRLRESRKWRRAVSWFLPSSPPPTSLFQKETRWTVQTLTFFQSSFPWDSCKSHWKEKVGVCGWLMTQVPFKRLDYKKVHASSLRFDSRRVYKLQRKQKKRDKRGQFVYSSSSESFEMIQMLNLLLNKSTTEMWCGTVCVWFIVSFLKL